MYCVTQQLAHAVPHALFAHQHIRERAERAGKKSPRKSVHAGHVAASHATRGRPAVPPPHARHREPHTVHGAPHARDTRQQAKVGRSGQATAACRARDLPVLPAQPAAPPAPQQREQDGRFVGRTCCWPAARAGGGRLLTAARSCQWRAKKGVNAHACGTGAGWRRVALEQCGHGGHDGGVLHANKSRRCAKLVGRKWPALPCDFPLSKAPLSDHHHAHPDTSPPRATRGAQRVCD